MKMKEQLEKLKADEETHLKVFEKMKEKCKKNEYQII